MLKLPGRVLKLFVLLLLMAGGTALSFAAPPVRLSGTMVTNGDVTASPPPQVTPNSNTVLFIADRVTNNTLELWSVPIIGGNPSNRSGTLAGDTVSSFKISPDGNWVAFLAESVVSGRFDLMLVPTVGSATIDNLSQIPVSVPLGVQAFDFAPNSFDIVFIADRVNDAVTQYELWHTTTAAPVPNKLSNSTTPGGNVTGFSIAPNGTTVVFRADRLVDNKFELWATPVAGGALTNLSGTFSATQSVSNYQIAPNSANVVFTGDVETDGVNEIFSVPIAGGARVKLSGTMVPGGSVDTNNFDISPNSQRVAFRAALITAGLNDFWSVPITSGTLIKLSNSVAGTRTVGGDLVFTPNSQRLVFNMNGPNGTEYWSSSITLGGPISVVDNISNTSGGSGFTLIAITPDSARIVVCFDRETAGLREIWTAPVTGGTVSRLSGGAANAAATITAFNVTPDGQRVLYVSDRETVGIPELWSVGVSGGPVTRISGELVSAGRVAAATGIIVSPDSQRAVFLADRATAGVEELWATTVDAGGAALDIDGDGKVLATTDMVLLTRWQLGIRGAALIANAVATVGATRSTAVDIEAYLTRLQSMAAP